jgi:hypothetical protein
MKSLLVALTLLSVGVGALAVSSQDSPLVKAAKATGGPKKKSTKKVITNKDVKKSTGKLVVLPARAAAQEPSGPLPQPKGPLEKQDDQRRVRLVNEARVAAAEKKVADLEKELRRLEEAYYAENDPNYRDATIGERFNQTKRQLETARKELADARDQ